MNVNFIPDPLNLLEVSELENDPAIGESIEAIYTLLLKKDKNFVIYISFLATLADWTFQNRNFNSIIEKLIGTDPDDEDLKIFAQCVLNILKSKYYAEIDRIKGLFPQGYVFRSLKNYKQYDKLERECYVEIDSWSTKIKGAIKQTGIIDTGCWNTKDQEGRVFECKFGKGLKKHQLNILDEISNRSDNKIRTFIATFAEANIVRNRIKEMKASDPGIKTDKLNVYGLSEIKNL